MCQLAGCWVWRVKVRDMMIVESGESYLNNPERVRGSVIKQTEADPSCRSPSHLCRSFFSSLSVCVSSQDVTLLGGVRGRKWLKVLWECNTLKVSLFKSSTHSHTCTCAPCHGFNTLACLNQCAVGVDLFIIYYFCTSYFIHAFSLMQWYFDFRNGNLKA